MRLLIYDINHENNWKWMPYAHALNEWVTGATKRVDKNHNKALMFDIMDVTQIQLHQGSHSDKKLGMGEAGYLTRVHQYLDKIKDNGFSHFDSAFKCGDCSGKEQKDLYPPRENTIRYCDKERARNNLPFSHLCFSPSLPVIQSQKLENRTTIPPLLLNQNEQIQTKSERQNSKLFHARS